MDELPEPYVQLPPMNVWVRVLMLVELPMLAPLFRVTLPTVTRLSAVTATF